MPPRRKRPQTSPALVAFGRQMRRSRDAKGFSQESIARMTQVSGPQVSKIETGKKRATRAFVEIVDEHLEANGALLNLWEDLNKDGHPVPVWFDWPEIESDAVELVSWEHTLVPGLLQKEAYAYGVLGSQDSVEVRMARQSILARNEPPPVVLTALLGETVLNYLVDSPEAMHEQMEHLLAASELPNITIQLVRNNGRPAGTAGAFAVATMGDRSEIAYLETIVRGITTDDPSDLAQMSNSLRELRARALPADESREILRKAVERWT